MNRSSIQIFADKLIAHLCDEISQMPNKKFTESKAIYYEKAFVICVNYLSQFKTIDYPPELILLLNIIKNTAQQYNTIISNEQVNALLGSVAFLRLICPILTTSKKLEEAINKRFPNGELNKIILGKGLLHISNQTDPEMSESNNLNLYPIRKNMRNLHEPVAAILKSLATQPPNRISNLCCIAPAYQFYGSDLPGFLVPKSVREIRPSC